MNGRKKMKGSKIWIKMNEIKKNIMKIRKLEIMKKRKEINIWKNVWIRRKMREKKERKIIKEINSMKKNNIKKKVWIRSKMKEKRKKERIKRIKERKVWVKRK